MADTKPNADSAAATERAHAPTAALGGTQVPHVSLDDLLEKELGAEPKQKQPAAKREKRATSNEDDEDEDDDEVIDTEDDDSLEEDDDEVIDDETDSEDDDDSEAEEEDDTDEDEDSEEEGQDAESEDDDQAKKPVPKGMEELAADKKFGWAAKRIQKQSRDIEAFRAAIAQGAVALLPTGDYPLAHADTEEKLASAIAAAKESRTFLSEVKDDDYQENAKGVPVLKLRENGKRVEKTKEQVEAELKALDATLSDEVIQRQRRYNDYRQQNRPWEAATAVCPEMFQPNTSEHAIYNAVLKLCPALKATVGDHEIILARAIRDMKRDQESAPTKEYPKGRFKWVRYELSKDGKVVPSKRVGKAAENSAGKGKARTLEAPSNNRPPMRNASGKGGKDSKSKRLEADRRFSEARTDDALTELLAAELG